VVVLGLVGSGCGGLQGSHSVSPATFFMPGLSGQVAPASPVAAASEPIHP
jgi:hypothetical protein